MEDRKYILTDAMKKVNGHILHRVKATTDFASVRAGDLGGFIEKEKNLSHKDLCWVDDEACIFGDARVYGNAWVFGDARVFDNARILEDVRVCGDVQIYGGAFVYGYAQIYGGAQVFEDAYVSGDALVFGDAKIHGDARVRDRAKIYTGNLTLRRSSLCLGPIGSRDDCTTFFLTDNKILVTCGCFKGDISEFEDAVHKTHAGTKHETDYIDAIRFVKSYFSK